MMELQNIRAGLFDFDGLIINSEPFWEKADEAILREQDKEYTLNARIHMLGKGLRESTEYFKQTFGLGKSVDELIEERSALMYNFLLPNAKLMDGVVELIYSFHKKGIVLAVVTGGHKKEKVVEILDSFGLDLYFPVVITREDVKRGKPAPDPFLKAASALGVKSEECLVLEDSPSGVVSGKAAGMVVYGVNGDREILEKLREAGADRVFGSLEEIHV
jgi:HAD superfamily hydrolase (TIGR01509 family)